MNRERIQHAIKVLQRVRKTRPRKFDMGTWADLRPSETDRFRQAWTQGHRDSVQIALNGCGTHGCALGWLASDPICISEGLILEFGLGGAGVRYFFETGERAGTTYFGIPSAMGALLFMPSTYHHAKGVKAIDEVIERLELLLVADVPTAFDMLHSQRAMRP